MSCFWHIRSEIGNLTNTLSCVLSPLLEQVVVLVFENEIYQQVLRDFRCIKPKTLVTTTLFIMFFVSGKEGRKSRVPFYFIV